MSHIMVSIFPFVFLRLISKANALFWDTLAKATYINALLASIIASLCCMYSISSDSSTREELRERKKKGNRKEEVLPYTKQYTGLQTWRLIKMDRA